MGNVGFFFGQQVHICIFDIFWFLAICISLIFCGAKSVGAGMRSLYSGDRVVDRPGSIYTPVAKCRILKRNLEDFFSRYNCCCVCPRCPSVIFKTQPWMKYAVKSGKVQQECRVQSVVRLRSNCYILDRALNGPTIAKSPKVQWSGECRVLYD